jgi:hypothetical protein
MSQHAETYTAPWLVWKYGNEHLEVSFQVIYIVISISVILC